MRRNVFMNTKDTLVVSGIHTQAAIDRLKEYLLSANLNSANVCVKSDMLFVEFAGGPCPTEADIYEVRKIFYWIDELTVPHIDGFVHYYDQNNTLLVNLVHYEEVCKICEKLKGFGAVLKGFDLNFHEYTFTYDVPGRSNLNYPELLEIEQIIEPTETESLEHLSVFRMGKFYTLTIKHVSWKN